MKFYLPMNYRKGSSLVTVFGPMTEMQFIDTPNGPRVAEVGDFVIVNPETGDIWPIKLEIFAATYDPVVSHGKDCACRGCMLKAREAWYLGQEFPEDWEWRQVLAVPIGVAGAALLIVSLIRLATIFVDIKTDEREGRLHAQKYYGHLLHEGR